MFLFLFIHSLVTFSHLYAFAFYLLILYVFRFFLSILFLCRPVFSHHIPKRKKNKSKIQTPKSRSKSASALGQTQKLRPERLKHLNPLLPLIFDEKIGLFAPYVFHVFFPVIKAALCFSVRFIGFPITSQNAKKKSREFPLGGPSPCGKQD